MNALLLALLAVVIPLKSIYSTSHQEGIQRARLEPRSRDGKGRPGSLSNVFLVEAESSDEAIKAGNRILTGSRASHEPTGRYWLVAYLGSTSSTPPAWIVDGVAIDGERIRFNYHRRRAHAATADMHPYIYYVPLGELEPGKYRLELFDGEDVTLMRRVEVGAE